MFLSRPNDPCSSVDRADWLRSPAMTDVDIRPGTVTANGLTFSYLEAGTGPLALCLHGFPDCADGWRPLLGALAQAGFHAVAPYMRGYAPTEVPTDGRYQSGVLVADANALHEALGGDPRAVIIGHDWGAFAAYGAPNIAPDRWTRAVIASVPPTSVLMPLLLSYDTLKHNFWYQFVFCNPLADLAVPMNDFEFLDRLWADWSPGLDGSEPIAAVKAALRDPAHLSAALGYYRHTLGLLHSDPALQAEQGASMQLPPIPTLYLHGVDDGCMPAPARAALEEAFSTPGSRVELIADAGHFLQYEQPARVAELVVDFITT
jgi:pimeloyl-ACP methyl ester carboxylesterase